jgi:hypothetical protein
MPTSLVVRQRAGSAAAATAATAAPQQCGGGGQCGSRAAVVVRRCQWRQQRGRCSQLGSLVAERRQRGVVGGSSTTGSGSAARRQWWRQRQLAGSMAVVVAVGIASATRRQQSWPRLVMVAPDAEARRQRGGVVSTAVAVASVQLWRLRRHIRFSSASRTSMLITNFTMMPILQKLFVWRPFIICDKIFLNGTISFVSGTDQTYRFE